MSAGTPARLCAACGVPPPIARPLLGSVRRRATPDRQPPLSHARIRAEFVEVLAPDHARMLVWERGAGATLACGTGACAVVVAGVLEGRLARATRVDLPGGPLHIEWREADNRVYMTGPAELVFNGSLELSRF